MTKNIIWIVGIVLAIALVFVWARSGNDPSLDFQVGVVNPLDNIRGNASSTVVIMEYSDFQCPACRSYYPIVRQIMTEYGDRVALVYRHFPLLAIHPNSEFAARAAEAAKKQGKFWEMHDLLFEKQNEWASASDIMPIFESYATLLGINVEQFKTDFLSNDVKNFVRAERSHAVRSGLEGTPTFFINGDKIQNPPSLEAFRTILQTYLSKQ